MNYQDLTLEICRLVDKNNQWTSAIIIPQGDGLLDVSSALRGVLSSHPVGATNQPTAFPVGKSASFYRFDPDLFYGEQSWPALKNMLINAGRSSGCRLITRSSYLRVSINRKATYELRCCHGLTAKKGGSSKFDGDDVGPCNVRKERIKHVKTFGALKGMSWLLFTYYFQYILQFYCSMNS